MRVFMTRDFARFARKEGLEDARLCDAIARAERGLVDADLGGHVIKQRIARPGQGRSRGYRTVIAFRSAERSVFMYGFGKNERDNIDDLELADLKRLAGLLLGLSEDEVATAVRETELKELSYAGQDEERDA